MPTNFDKTDVGVVGTSLGTVVTAPCGSVGLTAALGNSANIFWGDKTLQNMPLEAGDFNGMPADYVEEIYVRSASGVQTVHVAYSTK